MINSNKPESECSQSPLSDRVGTKQTPLGSVPFSIQSKNGIQTEIILTINEVLVLSCVEYLI